MGSHRSKMAEPRFEPGSERLRLTQHTARWVGAPGRRGEPHADGAPGPRDQGRGVGRVGRFGRQPGHRASQPPPLPPREPLPRLPRSPGIAAGRGHPDRLRGERRAGRPEDALRGRSGLSPSRPGRVSSRKPLARQKQRISCGKHVWYWLPPIYTDTVQLLGCNGIPQPSPCLQTRGRSCSNYLTSVNLLRGNRHQRGVLTGR